MVDWNRIDTVLLDMDGTLLDLRFDNHFWLEHLPRRYAEKRGMAPGEAAALLAAEFDRRRGSLEWYCVDYWSQRLELDLKALKEEVRHLIAERPQALRFLEELGAAGMRRVLVTNAHPVSLELKLAATGIGAELDRVYSSHAAGAPKESRRFWEWLAASEPFEPARTLFIDDSLPVLEAAADFGVGHLLAVRRPDSALGPRETGRFAAFDHFSELLPVRRNGVAS